MSWDSSVSIVIAIGNAPQINRGLFYLLIYLSCLENSVRILASEQRMIFFPEDKVAQA